MSSSSRIPRKNNNSLNRNISSNEDSMEETKEEDVEVLVEEEDEVVDLYNIIILEHWDIITEISLTCKHNVLIVSLLTTLLRTFRS